MLSEFSGTRTSEAEALHAFHGCARARAHLMFMYGYPVLAGCSCMPRVKGKAVRWTRTTTSFSELRCSPRLLCKSRSRRSLDPPHHQDYRRYAGELHTSPHAALALAPTSRASQQPCRATPKPALTLTTPARPSSPRARCSSRRGRSFRRAPSPRSTASSWTAWYSMSNLQRCAVHRG